MSQRLACGVLCLVLQASTTAGQPGSRPLSLLDVPFISQSEALCGGAAAAMILRYWGERGLSAESFAHLVDRSAAGIRTSALAAELRKRGWRVQVVEGNAEGVRRQIDEGRPVLVLIEDRPGAFHYVVLVGWTDRGVIFHDPARAPYRVMAPDAFERRWKAAKHWMLVLTPVTRDRPAPAPETTSGTLAGSSNVPVTPDCARLIEQGVQQAQARDLGAADRSLTTALACPGSASLRELAGVRVLQSRWSDAADLAAAALVEDPSDAHAWRLLATSRFVQDDPDGALRAWNRVGEPRIDLVEVEGLSRTRHRVVERLVDLRSGELLTSRRFLRAERRLGDLPAAWSARLEYRPVPSGLAEMRAFVSERPAVPSDRFALLSAGLSAATRREVDVALSSLTGGGERVELGWRFWRDRPRVSLGVRAPAPWGGLWGIDAFGERHSWTSPGTPDVRRGGYEVRAEDWATGELAWSLAGGMHAWDRGGSFGMTSAALRAVLFGGRTEASLRATAWSGRGRFGTIQAGWRWRSSARPTLGRVIAMAVQTGAATGRTPADLWFAGDTGHVRSSLLRAHPALDGGRLRLDRFGRTLVGATIETQRWWLLPGGVRAAAAVFGDAARVAHRQEGRPLDDVDVGVGARFILPGVTGAFRVDVGRGLRDGATALSLVFDPNP